MDFRPSPAQQILISTARAFLRQHCPPELIQRLALDERGFDETLWRRMAELGWPGLLIPLELCGSGGSLIDVILLVEEMGRAGLPGPFVTSAVVATSLLLAAGSPAQQKRLLPALADRPGIAHLPLDAISGEKLFEVTFDGVEVRPDDLLGAVGDGHKLLAGALQAGAMARAAEMVGGTQRVLELAVEHAKTRVQGGRPIGGYQ